MARILRIATFNLENLDDRPGLQPGIDDRIRVLRPELLRLSADVLCLQEVNAQEAAGHGPRSLAALDKLLRGTPYAGFNRVVSKGWGGKGPADVHNLVILSRLPVLGERQYWHDFVPPPVWRMLSAVPAAKEAEPVAWDRPVLHATLALEGALAARPLHVFNLHLRALLAAFVPGQKKDSFTWNSVPGWAEGFFLTSLKRAGQALEARIAIDRLFDQDAEAMIAVCGDFNAGARETPVRAIRAEEDDTGNPGLSSRALVALERSVPQPQRYSVMHGGERAMLDHLLVSRALLAFYRRAEIHNEALEDELGAFATARPAAESFHAPVVAEFEFPD
ncbi:MAG TPA: endonuclease/exonuclease/phosphatase family protein [Alphaproteobacteria bacterium]|jgi:endonuclease/exonuclease/phosphatase family metal-dependent hydrolase|nr:endonuclease/exonuclease/phosphatase family protein [Alphaproteobacteria bacterium]